MTQANEPATTENANKAVAETTPKTKNLSYGVAILVGIGLIVGGILLGIADKMPQGSWSRIDLGQDKAVSILGADEYKHPRADHTRGIYVGTSSGDVYACWTDTNSFQRPDRCIKETIKEIPQGSIECASGYATPSPPGEVIDSGCAASGSFSLGHIVILSDGSVWEWTKYFGEGPSFGSLGSIACIGLGVVISIVAIVLWLKQYSAIL